MAQRFKTPITIEDATSASSQALAANVNGDTQNRVQIDAGGKVTWGDGSSAGDTNLYRSAADALKTDDTLEAASGLITLTTSGAPTASLSDGALAIDTTNDEFYIRSGGAWVKQGGGGATQSDTAPSNPVAGDLWYETDTGAMYVYYDSAWIEVGTAGVIAMSTTSTPPSSPGNGDLWFDIDTARTYVYYDDGSSQQWIEVGAASAAASGADGSVQFASGGTFSSDDANLHWDDTNNRLGIGTTSPAVALDVVGTTDTDYLTVGGENVTPYTGRRNLLYNGAMQVAQRGTSTTGITSSGYYTADRFRLSLGTQGTWTHTVENDGPDGYPKSFKMLCTAADASPAAGDFVAFQQYLEGYDVQGIKKGTPSALQLTLSFWVKSNVTGTYIAELRDDDNTRQVSASYTVSASGTWEKKTITFPADTTGTFNNDNSNSLSLILWQGAGSTYSSGTLNTSWASSVSANRAAGQTNLASAVNNYWQVTGVQLEVGDKATPFEHRSYGEELALCERYYQIGSVVPQTSGNSGSYFQTTGSNNFGAINTVAFRTRMRTVPTMGWNFTSTDNANVTQYYVNQDSCGIRVIANNAGFLYCSYYASFNASAEL